MIAPIRDEECAHMAKWHPIAVACLATAGLVAWEAATHLAFAGEGSSSEGSDHVPTAIVILAFAAIAAAGILALVLSGYLRARSDD
jgi:hypothetical protein